jgi:hypothetical protein
MTDTQTTAIIVGGFSLIGIVIQAAVSLRLRRQSSGEHYQGYKTSLDTNKEVKDIKEAVNGVSQGLRDEIVSLKAQLKRERED